jgi:hypothetical protein
MPFWSPAVRLIADGRVDSVSDPAFARVEWRASPVLRATIRAIRASGALAFGGKGRRMAFVGESGRRGTGRMMLAMPISGGFGASRLSGCQVNCSREFESNHLLLAEQRCRSSCHCKLEISCDERIRVRLKANAMSLRPTTLAVLTTGLIAAAGLSGCQVPRSFRSFEFRSFPWRRAPQPRPHYESDRVGSESYLPESADVPSPIPQPVLPQPVTPDQPRLRLSPDQPPLSDPANDIRPIPVPPALEPEAPQARRWRPSQPNRPASQYTSQSDSSVEDFNLPPARVTYNTEATPEEPAAMPVPESSTSSQPRLFRPAGSAKNLYDTMKRKLSR